MTITLRYEHEGRASFVQDYLVGLPSEIKVVETATGRTLRLRRGEYDTRGNLEKLKAHLIDEGDIAESSLTYDATYGNLTSITDPNGYSISYLYESELNTHIREIRDSFGYTSRATYDYRFGLPLTQTDIAGAVMRREYDEHGRLVEVFAPYDSPSGIPSLAMEYYPDEFPQRAVTRNKVSFDPSDSQTITTVIITDGLRRVVQTKADAEVYDPDADDTELWQVV